MNDRTAEGVDAAVLLPQGVAERWARSEVASEFGNLTAPDVRVLPFGVPKFLAVELFADGDDLRLLAQHFPIPNVDLFLFLGPQRRDDRDLGIAVEPTSYVLAVDQPFLDPLGEVGQEEDLVVRYRRKTPPIIHQRHQRVVPLPGQGGGDERHLAPCGRRLVGEPGLAAGFGSRQDDEAPIRQPLFDALHRSAFDEGRKFPRRSGGAAAKPRTDADVVDRVEGRFGVVPPLQAPLGGGDAWICLGAPHAPRSPPRGGSPARPGFQTRRRVPARP